MRGLVIYASHYGDTKTYAQWIAQALSCPAVTKPRDLANYDVLIFGGGLYAGGVHGVKALTKHYPELQDKHLVLFTCGLADPGNPDNVTHIDQALANALTPEMMNRVRRFYFRGGIDYHRLGPVHRAMMAMLRRYLLSRPAERLRPEDRQLLDTYGMRLDFRDQASIAPLVAYVTGLVDDKHREML